MYDKTIPFYDLILRCDGYAEQPVRLPRGFSIVPYRPGFEADWARMEREAGDFDSEDEALRYFAGRYLDRDRDGDILFLLEETGRAVGSCIAWEDGRNGTNVHSLHWLIVEEALQGRKLGRALCLTAMDLFRRKGEGPVYIHTQPWSWKAILLYASLGFRVQRSDSFGGYVNRYEDAMRTLKRILPEQQFRMLEENAEN